MVIQFYKKIILIFCLFMIFAGCKRVPMHIKRVAIPSDCNAVSVPVSQVPSITVWVHGTRLMPSWAFSDFFYSKPGLFAAKTYDKRYWLRSIADILSTVDMQQFPLEHFYCFGWSGLLSMRERDQAGLALYHALLDLVENYKVRYGSAPRLTVITHSHGGNVALNVAYWQQKNSKTLSIDRLILLACPVQKKTENFVRDAMFNRVYSLYSSIDAIQVIDPQGIQYISLVNHRKLKTPLFSQRLFSHTPL